MFQLLPCSRCQRTFSIRQEVSSVALLKCPNCGNQFRIGELLDALYEPWQVVEDQANLLTSTPVTGYETNGNDPVASMPVAAGQEFPGDTNRLLDSDLELVEEGYDQGSFQADTVGTAAAHANGAAHEFMLGPDRSANNSDSEDDPLGNAAQSDKPSARYQSGFTSPGKEVQRRVRRNERSGIWSTLQVVLGGAAAIPVTLFLLWYVWGQDVVGAGPAVARYVPWIVPRKFHGYEQSEPVSQANRARRQPRDQSESGFRNFDDILTPANSTSEQDTDEATTSRQPENGDQAVSNNASSEKISASDAARVSELSPPSGITSESPVKAAPSNGNLSATADQKSSPRGADAQMAGLFANLANAKQKIAAWREPPTVEEQQRTPKDDDRKKRRIIALLDDLALIGEGLASASEESGALKLWKNDLRDVARTIAADADLEKWFNLAVRAQFNGLPRSTAGRVLLCRVGQFEETSSSWQIIPSDEALLELKLPIIDVPKRLVMQLRADERLFLLGTMTGDLKDETEPTGEDVPKTTQAQEESQALREDSDARLSNGAPEAETFKASFSYSL